MRNRKWNWDSEVSGRNVSGQAQTVSNPAPGRQRPPDHPFDRMWAGTTPCAVALRARRPGSLRNPPSARIEKRIRTATARRGGTHPRRSPALGVAPASPRRDGATALTRGRAGPRAPRHLRGIAPPRAWRRPARHRRSRRRHRRLPSRARLHRRAPARSRPPDWWPWAGSFSERSTGWRWTWTDLLVPSGG